MTESVGQAPDTQERAKGQRESAQETVTGSTVSPKSYAKDFTPVPENVALFENRVAADVISYKPRRRQNAPTIVPSWPFPAVFH